MSLGGSLRYFSYRPLGLPKAVILAARGWVGSLEGIWSRRQNRARNVVRVCTWKWRNE